MAADIGLDDQGCLQLHGRLDRQAVESLWPRIAPLQGRVRALELSGLSGIDSAGLALLVTLATAGATVQGEVPGLLDLATAYRLPASLALPIPSALPV